MILTAAFRPSLAVLRPLGDASSARSSCAASRGAPASAPCASAAGAAARARAADPEAGSEPAAERGWFESSRELLAGLTVIELAGPAAAAALQ